MTFSLEQLKRTDIRSRGDEEESKAVKSYHLLRSLFSVSESKTGYNTIKQNLKRMSDKSAKQTECVYVKQSLATEL